MDNQFRRIKFYNFNNRQYKRQPYILEFNIFYKSFIISFYPLDIDIIKTFKGKDFFVFLPNFKFSYVNYKDYQYENIINHDWYDLIEDDPF